MVFFLTNLFAGVFDSLAILFSLTEADFSSLHNLEELYLSNISLHTIHESPFRMLTKLTILDLSQNQISTLPSHLFLQVKRSRICSKVSRTSPQRSTLSFLNED